MSEVQGMFSQKNETIGSLNTRSPNQKKQMATVFTQFVFLRISLALVVAL